MALYKYNLIEFPTQLTQCESWTSTLTLHIHCMFFEQHIHCTELHELHCTWSKCTGQPKQSNETCQHSSAYGPHYMCEMYVYAMQTVEYDCVFRLVKLLVYGHIWCWYFCLTDSAVSSCVWGCGVKRRLFRPGQPAPLLPDVCKNKNPTFHCLSTFKEKEGERKKSGFKIRRGTGKSPSLRPSLTLSLQIKYSIYICILWGTSRLCENGNCTQSANCLNAWKTHS